jgi:hypothetical protein
MKKLPECPVAHGSIRNIACGLVDNAPACTTFNGVALRAKYKTTRVSDIVAQYKRKLEERAARWHAANPEALAIWDRLTFCGTAIPARPRYDKEEIRKLLAEMARGFGFEVVVATPQRVLAPGEKKKWYRFVDGAWQEVFPTFDTNAAQAADEAARIVADK